MGILITLLEMGHRISALTSFINPNAPGENGILIMSHNRTPIKKTGPVMPNDRIIVDYFDRGFHYAKP